MSSQNSDSIWRWLCVLLTEKKTPLIHLRYGKTVTACDAADHHISAYLPTPTHYARVPHLRTENIDLNSGHDTVKISRN